ncbi:MAG: transposase [Gammaproteobacteria bacterium]
MTDYTSEPAQYGSAQLTRQVQIANVLDKLPKRLQGRAKRALHEIMYAETRAQAEQGIEAFVAEFSPKYEKAVDCLIKDREALLAFFEWPASLTAGACSCAVRRWCPDGTPSRRRESEGSRLIMLHRSTTLDNISSEPVSRVSGSLDRAPEIDAP